MTLSLNSCSGTFPLLQPAKQAHTKLPKPRIENRSDADAHGNEAYERCEAVISARHIV